MSVDPESRPRPESRERVMTLAVGRTYVAVPIASVVETMRPLPIEQVRGMPPFVLGLSIVRGRPTPVVDAAMLVGASGAEPSRRFVSLRHGDRGFALAAPRVIGVRTLDADLLHALTPLTEALDAEPVRSIGVLDASLLVVLRASRIVPEDAWTELERAAGPGKEARS